jgi:hypothetical protein
VLTNILASETGQVNLRDDGGYTRRCMSSLPAAYFGSRSPTALSLSTYPWVWICVFLIQVSIYFLQRAEKRRFKAHRL